MSSTRLWNTEPVLYSHWGCRGAMGICPSSLHVFFLIFDPFLGVSSEGCSGGWVTGSIGMGCSVSVQMEKRLVSIAGSKSDSFPVGAGLCQGCPLSQLCS